MIQKFAGLFGVLFLVGCDVQIDQSSPSTETRFSTTDQEYYEAYKVALKESGVPYRETENGELIYQLDSSEAESIRAALDLRQYGAVGFRAESEEINDRFVLFLEEKNIEYFFEPSPDGKMIRYYPPEGSDEYYGLTLWEEFKQQLSESPIGDCQLDLASTNMDREEGSDEPCDS